MGTKAVNGERAGEVAFRTLLRTCGLVGRVMQPYFARHGISGAQWGILRTLHRAEAGGEARLRMSELSARLLIRPPSVTGTVDRLQRMGLVTRDASAADARTKPVRLTSAGRQLVERVLRGHSQQIEEVLAGLSPPQQRELNQLLERLAGHLEGMVEGRDEGT